jgi:hypothetical protein
VLVAGRYMQFFEQPLLKSLFASYPGAALRSFTCDCLRFLPVCDTRLQASLCRNRRTEWICLAKVWQ